jgi:hypothetical protein
MPAVCAGRVADDVLVQGVDAAGAANVGLNVDFENCPECDDFVGYDTECSFGGGGLSTSPDVQCYVPAGKYQVTLGIDEYNDPVSNAVVPPGTATLTASIGGNVIQLPEPSTLLLCSMAALLAIAVARRRTGGRSGALRTLIPPCQITRSAR